MFAREDRACHLDALERESLETRLLLAGFPPQPEATMPARRAWDSTVQDLSVHKPTKLERMQRRKSIASANKEKATAEMQHRKKNNYRLAKEMILPSPHQPHKTTQNTDSRTHQAHDENQDEFYSRMALTTVQDVLTAHPLTPSSASAIRALASPATMEEEIEQFRVRSANRVAAAIGAPVSITESTMLHEEGEGPEFSDTLTSTGVEGALKDNDSVKEQPEMDTESFGIPEIPAEEEEGRAVAKEAVARSTFMPVAENMRAAPTKSSSHEVRKEIHSSASSRAPGSLGLARLHHAFEKLETAVSEYESNDRRRRGVEVSSACASKPTSLGQPSRRAAQPPLSFAGANERLLDVVIKFAEYLRKSEDEREKQSQLLLETTDELRRARAALERQSNLDADQLASLRLEATDTRISHSEAMRDLTERVANLEASRNESFARSLITGMMSPASSFDEHMVRKSITAELPSHPPRLFSPLKEVSEPPEVRKLEFTGSEAANVEDCVVISPRQCFSPDHSSTPQTPPPRTDKLDALSLPSPPLPPAPPTPPAPQARTPLPANETSVARDLCDALDDVAVSPAPTTWVQWGAWGRRLANDLQPSSNGSSEETPHQQSVIETVERSQSDTPTAIVARKFERVEKHLLTPETPAKHTRQRPPLAKFTPNFHVARIDLATAKGDLNPRPIVPLAWSPSS